MTDKNTSDISRKDYAGKLLNSLMVILMLIFVFLYAAAFSDKLDPLKDSSMLLHLEPILFILIGFYFGRLPARQSERALKEEIARQAQKADAAQYAKEKAQQDREMLEEKIRNVKTTLKTIAPPDMNDPVSVQSKAIKAAVRILDS